MRGLLALGGEAHLVIRNQIFGRCIHHAVPVRTPLFAILTVAVSVIESPLGTLLVMLASDPLPCGAHDGSTRRAVTTAPVVPAAHHEAGTTTRALALDTGFEHRNQLQKVGCRANRRDTARTIAAHFDEMLSQQPEGSEL